MIAELVYSDDGKPLGMVIQGENPGEKEVLARYHREGMVAVSYNAKDGLVVIFGRPAPNPAPKDTDAEEEPAYPSKYAG